MEKGTTETFPASSNNIVMDSRIPGVQAFARNIAEASEHGVLFFLAVELELLLRDYLKQNGLPPTPVDLEMMIAQAAKGMVGE
jgi:hypothetical protein